MSPSFCLAALVGVWSLSSSSRAQSLEFAAPSYHLADMDADGRVDVFLADPLGEDRLFRSLGDGRFEDVTASRGLAAPRGSLSALWFDFDSDGALDLLVCGADGLARLFQNAGSGAFVDVTASSGLEHFAAPYFARTVDADGAGGPDLHVVGEFGEQLFFNRGAGRFVAAQLPHSGAQPAESDPWSNAVADLPAPGPGASDAERAEFVRAARAAWKARRQAAVSNGAGPSSLSAPGINVSSTATSSAGLLAPSLICAGSVADWASSNCLRASSVPLPGMLMTYSAAVSLLGASIESNEIADGTIANADLANNSVNGAKVADGSLSGNDLGQMGASSGQVLRWTGFGWVPGSSRIVINASNTPGDANSVRRITLPGSYYLDANLTGVSGRHAIEVESDNVSIDLNGFAIQGVAGALDGISVNGARRNFTLRNGTIQGFPGSGVFAQNTNGGLFLNLFVQGNTLDGIWPGSESVVRNVHAISNTRNGLVLSGRSQVLLEGCISVDNAIGFDASSSSDCTFNACSARENRQQGIRSGVRGTLINCQARGNDLSGMEGGDRTTLIDCQSELNTQAGVIVGSGSMVSRCRSSDNGGNGFAIGSESIVTDSLAHSNVGSGYLGGFTMLIERCVASLNGIDGINVHTGGTVSNCRTRLSGQHGIVVHTSCRVVDNSCEADGGGAGVGGGVRFLGQANLIEGNNFIACENSVVAVSPSPTANLVVRNTSRSPTNLHFNFTAAGNSFGAFVNVVGIGDITPAVASNHPQANFLY